MTDTTISTDPATLRAWHLGAMNDGLFIIDAPPRPSTDDIFPDREDGPTLILNVTDLPHAKAQAIVDAHNATLSAITAAGYEIRPRAYTAGESLGGGLVAVPSPQYPVVRCARCAGKGEFLDTTYDRTGEMMWCRPCHGTGKMLDDRDVKAALAALTEKGERS
jgi:hypothetical protein